MTARGQLLNLLLTVLGRLSLPLNHRLGSAIGFTLGRFAPRAKTITQINLALCWPELSPDEQAKLAKQSFIEAGKAMTELGYFWRRPQQQVLGQIQQIEGLELFDAALAAGHGILIAAPHLGAWEILCQYLSSRGDSAILYRKPRDAGVTKIITNGRERLGAELIEASASGVRKLFKAAKQGKIIGILPDQQPKRGHGEFAEFFGTPALTMVLYSRLAARSRAAIMLAWVERLPRCAGYKLHFSAANEAVRDSDLARSTAALNQSIEQQVRRKPAQYQWSYKRFNRQPDGLSSPYIGTP